MKAGRGGKDEAPRVGNEAGLVYVNGRFTAQAVTGVQRFAYEMTRALAALHPGKVQVLAPPGAPAMFEETSTIGRGSGHWWEQMELPRHVKGRVLVNLGNTAPVMRRRQVVVLHDAGVFMNPRAYSRRFRMGYKALQALLAAGGSAIATVSESARRDLAAHLRLAPERVAVLHEGADHMTRIQPDATVLARHGLAPQRFVLAVGTLAAHKNLASLDMLAERLAEMGYVLAVTGGFGGSIFVDSSGQKMPPAARYLGRVSDEELKSLYEHAGCFVMPSLYEGFGLPAVEAMMCGCPVVAARIPALLETCGNAARFVDPAAPAMIADAVTDLLADGDGRAALRSQGARHAGAMTWRAAAARLWDVIEALRAERAVGMADAGAMVRSSP